MRLCDALAVTAVCRDPAAAAAGAPYRVLAQLAPALAARARCSTDKIMRMDIDSVSKLASDWAESIGMSDDLAVTLALAFPRQGASGDQG
jgi:hypothetical protein